MNGVRESIFRHLPQNWWGCDATARAKRERAVRATIFKIARGGRVLRVLTDSIVLLSEVGEGLVAVEAALEARVGPDGQLDRPRH
eukprot:6214435-Pleurochrysis_carterae.AAC.6